MSGIFKQNNWYTLYHRQLIYRWANLAGLLTNIFFRAIFSYVIIALYQAKPVAAGYDVKYALRYVWLAQATVMVVLTCNGAFSSLQLSTR